MPKRNAAAKRKPAKVPEKKSMIKARPAVAPRRGAKPAPAVKVTAAAKSRAGSARGSSQRVLVVDVGGTNIKLLATGKRELRRVKSGPDLTPARMVREVRAAVADWDYDVVTIGCPGPVVGNRIVQNPVNLGGGWMRYDFAKAFGKPVRLVNDAVMQAIGSYEGGRMLFLGLGTGLGTACILDGVVAPMEVAHLPYRNATFEDYVGLRGMKHFGKRRWREFVEDVVSRLREALQVEYIVLGGGHVKFLRNLPTACIAGSNANAITGGYRLWTQAGRFVLAGAAKKRGKP